MKAGAIEDLWRVEVDDAVEPFLWSHEDALEYLNDGHNEACRRIRALIDSSTTAICQLAVPVGGLATLDPRVIFVRKVRFSGRTPLRRMNMQDMERFDPMWQESSQVTYPEAFIPDFESGKLQFWPPNSGSLTALLTVVRDPLAEMTKRDDTPEINPRYHRSLRHWMSHRGYLKPDKETYDPKKAAEALALFELEFGKKSSAIDEQWIEREQFEGDGTY